MVGIWTMDNGKRLEMIDFHTNRLLTNVRRPTEISSIRLLGLTSSFKRRTLCVGTIDPIILSHTKSSRHYRRVSGVSNKCLEVSAEVT